MLADIYQEPRYRVWVEEDPDWLMVLRVVNDWRNTSADDRKKHKAEEAAQAAARKALAAANIPVSDKPRPLAEVTAHGGLDAAGIAAAMGLSHPSSGIELADWEPGGKYSQAGQDATRSVG